MKIYIFLFVIMISGCASYSEDISRVQSAGYPILIKFMNITGPDVAGGIDLWNGFVNTSGRPIKYLRYNVTAYNSVGDQVGLQRGIEKPGPFNPGFSTVDSVSDIGWGGVWYDSSIRCVEIDMVQIVWGDDTTTTYRGSDVVEMYVENSAKMCDL